MNSSRYEALPIGGEGLTALRGFQLIAIINGCVGALFAVGVVVMGVIAVVVGDLKTMLLGFALLTVSAAIAYSLLDSALAHRKKATRRTALALAANLSVLIWIICGKCLAATDLKEFVGPAHAVIALGLAYLAYRFFLKPAALQAFPE
jgi:uncharacterized membrane-anchored protein